MGAAARFAGVPVRIFTGHHSGELALYERPFLTFLDGASGKWLADYSIAPSGAMKEIFIAHQKIPARKIEVVHHGFDLEAWRGAAAAARPEALRAELGLEGKIVFGAVGRLFWVKDFATLVEAFAEAARGRDDVALLIVGGGDARELEKLIEDRQLRGKVRLAGRREDIAAVMNSFDVFVHSSLTESFGMVFIEAFALGKPVISTTVGVAPDIVENGRNGLLVAAANPPELARAIEQMLARRAEWAAMGAVNREIAERFAVRKTQRLCDDFYLKWLKEKTGN